ncbi:MAG: hypothetical protein GY801_46600 [bacterium]|nr:hypothetical protein [bacterium]
MPAEAFNRKDLNADALFEQSRTAFGKIPVVCAGFAMFSLKAPPIPAFERRRKEDTEVRVSMPI